MKKIKILSVCAFLVLSSCSTRLIDFTIISSKNLGLRVKESAKGPRVTGEDFAWVILIIPTGTPNMKEAVDRAIEKAGPGFDALVDGVVYSKFSWYLLATKSGYLVEGTPIKSSEALAFMTPEMKEEFYVQHNVIFHSKKGNGEQDYKSIPVISTN